MFTIDIHSESRYKIDRSRIKQLVKNALRNYGVKGKTELSIKIVGNRKIKALNRKYRDKDETTTVLSFPLHEGYLETPFVMPTDDVLRLGDIVISYPQALTKAGIEDKLVDEKIDELVLHGLKNLLGNQG